MTVTERTVWASPVVVPLVGIVSFAVIPTRAAGSRAHVHRTPF